MADHDLKCWPESFQAQRDGLKTYELRLDDRGYAIGDRLILREYRPPLLPLLPGDVVPGGYTGRVTIRIVTWITKGAPWLAPDYVCLAVQAPARPGIKPE